MKKSIAIALCLILVIAAAVSVLAACNSSEITVTLMDGDKVYDTVKVKVGESVTLPADPTKEGYKFAGWYTDEALTVNYVSSEKVMAAITLYAKFIPDELSVVINAKGGSVDPKIVTVKSGEAYTLPVPTKEGFDFTGYIYYDYNDEEKAFPTTGTYGVADKDGNPISVRVEATWALAKYAVAFMDGETAIKTYNAEIGTTIYAPTPTKDGYDFAGWLTEEGVTVNATSFDVAGAATYTAKWTAKTYSITVENLASANTTVTYQGTYTLPAEPALPAWAESFSGYTMNGEAFEATGTYTWTTNITVTANFVRDPEYQKSHVTVYTADTTTPATELVVDNGSTIAADLAALNTAKEGYDFVGWKANGQAFAVNTAINENITIYADYTAKTVVITVIRWDTTTTELTATYGEALDLPVPQARNGYSFKGYERTTGEAFSAPVLADFDAAFAIREKWEQLENPDADDTEYTYYKERASEEEEYTYVFLTGYSYEMKNIKAITGADEYFDIDIENGVATLDAKQNVGSFTMTLTKDVDGTDYTYSRQVKVVKNMSMTYGNDYTKIWVNTQQSTANFQVARNESSVMAAGVENFVFDVNIVTNAGNSETPNYVALPFAQANIDVSVKKGEQAVAESLYNVNTMTGAISFDNSLVGETVTVTLTPKYAASTNVKTFKLALNDGVNVYTNAELKSRYSDLGVHQINILRNITAELVADDYIAGHGKNIVSSIALNSATTGAQTLVDVDTGAPQNDYSHSVYTRITADTNDTMKINGNYFAIDGSKLPYIDNRYDQYGANGSQFTSGDSFRIAQVQIGIFLYRNCTLDTDGTTLARYQGGTLDMDNLLVTGNNVMSLADAAQDLGDGKMPLLKMSASYNGILCRGGTINLNNVSVARTAIGIFTDGGVDGYTGYEGNVFNSDKHAVVVNMNNSRVTESWANDIYGYHLNKFTLNNTVLGATSGGAAIAIDDRPASYAAADLETEINLDCYTAAAIQNWVTGQEAWFVAYGHSGTAISVKTTINDNVKGYSLTDLDSTSQMMNFAIFARSAGNYENSEWDADPQGAPSVKINVEAIPDVVVAGLLPAIPAETIAAIKADAEHPYKPTVQYLISVGEIDSSRLAVLQAMGLDEDSAYLVLFLTYGLHDNGINWWLQELGASLETSQFQIYLVYSMGSRNSVMTVGIPLYIQGTQPR